MTDRDIKYERQIEHGEERLKGPEWAAKTILIKLGFEVYEIPTSSGKTADFLVNGDDPSYVVEVASRYLPDSAWEDGARLNMIWDPKTHNWLNEACKQCRGVDLEHNRLWIVWASAEGPAAARHQMLRVRNTLYGVRTYLEVNPPHREVVACYAQPPLFERYPDIDMVLGFVDDDQGTGTALLPNEFSPRFEQLRRSKLVRELTAIGVPFATSDVHVARGGCVVPTNVDRSDVRAVLKYVQHTLGIPTLSPMASENAFAAVLQVSRSELEKA
jgi:hypothetical protein